ncbi:MAG: hypothetical protein AAGK37_22540 [Pseudomonadota bacterium]
MEERDYTGQDHSKARFSIKALFARRVLIDLGIAVVASLIIAGVALSGPLDQTGIVFIFAIFPAYFLASALFTIIALATRQGLDRVTQRTEEAGLPTWPIRIVGSAVCLFVIFLIVVR